MNIEEGIKRVYSGAPHVVILGAGASIASSLRNPEPNGKKLPSMEDFIKVVGLEDIVQKLPKGVKSRNFEEAYSNLYEYNSQSAVIQEIEMRVADYFKSIRLPPEPTIYDYLVLSLRRKDLIATFNWDPFLYDACQRNHHIADLPRVVYLHGSVRIGYCLQDRRKGLLESNCSQCKIPFTPSKLLFPIRQKNYSSDPHIYSEWDTLRQELRRASIATVFGYGAPNSDVESVQLLREAWGTPSIRDMEQFEFIDIQPESNVLERWKGFVHSHHYDYCTDYFESRLSLFPRRSGESFMHQFLPRTEDEMLQEPNPIPKDFSSIKQMWDWFNPLIQAERKVSLK